jgi:beta-glucanase (GH16 family)
MNTIEWSGYKWITQERWGEIHKSKSWCWYDKERVKVDDKNYLHLETLKHPKEFTLGGEPITSTYGVGLVSSVDDFGYGYFEIEAKLPTGKKLWPAFWMWSGPWPPEIDIFEGYTDNRTGYLKFNRFNPLGWWNIPTNIWTHKKENGKAVNLKARTGFCGFDDPAKNFLKYSCLWTENVLEIKHNGYVVRKITDPKQLEHFKGKKMNVIINNHFQPYPPEGDNYSDFIVKSFKYEKA